MITDEQLAEWEKLANAATPAPWAALFENDVATPDLVCVAKCPSYVGVPFSANQAFIAAAREAIPALIAEVRRLRQEFDDIAPFLAVHGMLEPDAQQEFDKSFEDNKREIAKGVRRTSGRF